MTTSTLFLNNKTQAVRLPSAVKMDASIKKVFIRSKGKERIISPIDGAWDSFFLDANTVSDDFMNTRSKQTESQRDTFDD